jgi:hypothetical protein
MRLLRPVRLVRHFFLKLERRAAWPVQKKVKYRRNPESVVYMASSLEDMKPDSTTSPRTAQERQRSIDKAWLTAPIRIVDGRGFLTKNRRNARQRTPQGYTSMWRGRFHERGGFFASQSAISNRKSALNPGLIRPR